MSKTFISKTLRARVAAQARSCCGYCLSQESVIGMTLEIDHLLPEARGGKTEEANLWLACKDCNGHKGDTVTATDPQTSAVVPLFNPRTQRWGEHFAWTPDGDEIVGQTAIGRATVVALDLNRAPLIRARKLWAKAGWHPPQD
ncbi:MAG TPA: HNH endonuclease signature motif containing protein [Ktedonobacterales bacterium]|nr:HNH endonuclease signature motif containing protein [Ktedonobacterales bacterium]